MKTQIKIIKCSNKDNWYRSNINKVYDFDGLINGQWRITDTDGSMHFIDYPDAEIIEQHID